MQLTTFGEKVGVNNAKMKNLSILGKGKEQAIIIIVGMAIAIITLLSIIPCNIPASTVGYTDSYIRLTYIIDPYLSLFLGTAVIFSGVLCILFLHLKSCRERATKKAGV